MSDIAINPVTRRVQFTGNTGTGPYAFTFNVLQSSDIVVYKNNVLLTETTDYTVSIATNGTGNITMVVALVLTDILTIIGGRELSRTTDFVTAGDLLASSLNEQLDSNVIMSQQLDERFGRTIKAQPGDEDAALDLPVVADRANRIISFDQSGNLLASTASGFFVGANFFNQTYTGDGSTTSFALTIDPGTKNNIQVYIDGVYQNKATFSTTSSTITFTEAPPLNAAMEFIIGNAVDNVSSDANLVNYNQGGTGAQTRTVENKLQEFVSRNDFDNDTNFTAAGTTASAKLNQIDFYKTSASGANSQILPTDRGLTFTPTLTNQRPAFNAAPNGTPSGTNTAYSVMRVWGQDIVNDPTGSRQALAMEMHYGNDSVLRSRLNTRSEGSPALEHPDFYWQINGSNCFYTGRKRDGTTGRTNIGFFPRGFGFRDTLATVYWSASETVTAGTTRLLTNSDFLYLECSVGGTTGGTEPDATAIGTSFTDGTVTWDVKTKFFLAGSSETTDAIPAIWMNEAGNTGFGTQSPVASYEFANRARFDGGIEFNDGTNVGATLNNIFTTTITTDFTGSLAAGASSVQTATLTGAALGDVVQMGLAKDNIIDDLVFTAYVSATNQVAIKCQNVGSGTVALTSETYRLAVLKF